MKALLIAEKDSVMEAIRNAYQKCKSSIPYDIDFGCCSGHILELCEPDEYSSDWGKPWRKEVLPIIPQKWKTKVSKPNYYNRLKDMWESNHYDVIINAGDSGREGQLIQHLVYDSLGINIPILRFWIDDTTEKTIIKALKNMKPDTDYQGLTNAAYLRLYFDWLSGINFSRAATLSLQRIVRLGRVMSAVLAIIVRRETEIKEFEPTNFYEITTLFTSGMKNYEGTLLNPAADTSFPTKFAFYNKSDAEKLLQDVRSTGTGEIKEITKEDKISRPPTLFNLSDLQKKCSNLYDFTPAKTLNIAQSLYEKHYLSYPRTESKCLTTEQAKTVPDLLQKLKAFAPVEKFITRSEKNGLIQKTLSSKKFVDNKKVSDHPALIPTEVIPSSDDLTKDEKLVYMLVVCRFIAIFLEDYITTKTTVITQVNTHLFRSTGIVEKQKGWKEISELVHSSIPISEILPDLTTGEQVSGRDYKIIEKQTTPPPRYNFGSLLLAMETAGKQLTDKELEQVLMECAGLGTSATRSEIIEKLLQYEYISRKGKTLYPTEQGIEYISVLSGHNIISPELTAVWEKKLKEVETGVITYEQFYNAMIRYITSEVNSLLTLNPIGRYHKLIGKCPKCNRGFYSYDSFYACEGYFIKQGEERACTFGLPKKFGSKALTETDVKSLISGHPTRPKEYTWKNGQKSKRSLILDTSTYKIAFAEKKSIGNCPCCGGQILIGSKGYYCENWAKKDENGNPACTFSVFGKIGKTTIKPSLMHEILTNGETKKDVVVVWESGKQFPGKLALQESDGKYRVIVKPFEKKFIGKCPYCKIGSLYEEKFRYACDNTPSSGGSCLAVIQKQFRGYSITAEDAITLLKTGHLKNRWFKNKENVSYKHSIHTEIDEQKGLIIKLDPFPKKK